jgi:predicted component of type VI protein secretion system
MMLELRVVGPGLSLVRLLAPGAAPLVIGRDADCGLCLPDPERNISRRHLSVWNEAGELRYLVLSEVNGVLLPEGEVPPGSTGAVPAGSTIRLAAYDIGVAPAEAGEGTGTDPWAALHAHGEGPTTPMVREAAAGTPEEDPFGDWGFASTFGPGAPGTGGLQAGQLGVAPDITAFFRGLGLDPAKIGALSEGELEAIGRTVRVAVLGLLEMQAQAFQAQQELGTDERTMVAAKERNPLTGNWPDHTKLQYLFGGRVTATGFASPERAVRDVAGDLLAHQIATRTAVRQALESLAGEFEPEAMKARLLGTGGRLFGAARAWEAFVREYEERGRDAGWAQHVLDRHFTEAYLREFLRVKGDTAARLR